jgi:hypothetical protein
MWWDGQYRIVNLGGAYCVCGHGRMIECDSRTDAQNTLAQLLAPSSTSGSPPLLGERSDNLGS